MKKSDKILFAIAAVAMVLLYLQYRKKQKQATQTESAGNTAKIIGSFVSIINNNTAKINESSSNQKTFEETQLGVTERSSIIDSRPLGITVIDADDQRFISPSQQNTSETYRLLCNSLNLMRTDGKAVIKERDYYDKSEIGLLKYIFNGTTVFDSETGLIDKQFVYAFSSAVQRIYNKTILNVNLLGVAETIKKGDKGQTVLMLQTAINCMLHSNELSQTGCYDRDTTKMVLDIFKTSGVIINQTTGEIDSQFVQNLYNIIRNINQL